MGYALRDEDRHTYADYVSWSEDARYELINGRAFLMPPAPTADHQTIAFQVAHQIENALRDRPCQVFIAPLDVMLDATPSADDDSIEAVVQPDALVVCDPARVTLSGIRGAPDWVLEVISPSSASHDYIEKLAAYERAGVREYWLVHPIDRMVTIYRLAGATYGRPGIAAMSGETAIAVLGGLVIRWDSIVKRLVGPPGVAKP